MHELGVRLYRQRMRREHPQASTTEVNAMVRAWLAEPPQNGSLRLPSRGPLSARSGGRDRHATIRMLDYAAYRVLKGGNA
jgi:hypothetical protein